MGSLCKYKGTHVNDCKNFCNYKGNHEKYKGNFTFLKKIGRCPVEKHRFIIEEISKRVKNGVKTWWPLKRQSIYEKMCKIQNCVLLAAAEECHQSLTLEAEVKINTIYIQLCSKKKSEEKLPLNFRYIRRGIKTYKIREKKNKCVIILW